MKIKDKKQLANLVTDYKLWIAFIEQFLDDHNISNQQINNQLQYLNKTLSSIMTTNEMPKIIDQILLVDDRLKTIQTQIPQMVFQPA